METVSEHLLGDEGPVSRWWLRIVGIVMVVGFALLVMITGLAYRNAPPIPDKVVDAQGTTLFTGEDIRSGQALFLLWTIVLIYPFVWLGGGTIAWLKRRRA